MTKKLLTLSFCAVLGQSFAQNAALDAIKLRTNINSEQQIVSAEDMAILSSYYAEEVGFEDLKKNPFFGKYLPDQEPRSNDEIISGIGFGDKGKAPAAGGKGFALPAPQILTALTNFLVKRAKTELGIMFFNGFKKKMQESEELQKLFPTAARSIDRIDQDLFNFNAFLGTLKENFTKDMDNLFFNLETYLMETPKIKNEHLRTALGDLSHTMYMLKQQASPTDIIRYLGQEGAMHQTVSNNDTLETFKSTMRLLSVFSESLKAPKEDSTRLWIDKSIVDNLLKDKVAFDIYLGMIYAQSKNARMGQKSIGDHLRTTNRTTLANSISNFYRNVRALQDAFSAERQQMAPQGSSMRTTAQAAPERTYEDFYTFTQHLLRTIESGYDLRTAVAGANGKQDSTFFHYTGLLRDFNELFWDVHQKKYASLIMDAMVIILKVIPDNEKTACVQGELLKYGTFIATVVNAASVEEIEKAIETLSLPPGSASLKKYAAFSISLNAYVGVGMGQEMLRGTDPKIYQAVATPIGVAFNFGFKKAGSLSIMASVLDIGALTAFRFQDTTMNLFPDVRFENVLAPGGYLVYGVPKFPLSIGFGAQMGPNLRSVNKNGVGGPAYNFNKTNGWRFGAFIAVDIPMVNIFSTNKQQRRCHKKKED